MVRVDPGREIIDLSRDGHIYVAIGQAVGVSKSTRDAEPEHAVGAPSGAVLIGADHDPGREAANRLHQREPTARSSSGSPAFFLMPGMRAGGGRLRPAPLP
jgi:hypothetical protein